MARRRLALITFSLFLFIVILTLYSYNIEDDDVIKNGRQLKKYYQQRRPTISTSTSCPDSGHCNFKLFRQYTLTKLGADLKFDPFNSCPKYSLMTSNIKDTIKGKTKRCPKVFIVGAKKGGTTSLYQYLSKHPDFKGINLNTTKWMGETHYFAQKFTTIPLNAYLKQFSTHKMSGDASVDNLLHCKAPLRIWKTCGTSYVKIIILLRHPIQRYVSNFMMRVAKRGYTTYLNVSSINEAVTEDVISFVKRLKKFKTVYPTASTQWHSLRCLFECCSNMIYEGLYYVFVMNWLCNFPKENMLFINSEELFYNPIQVLQQVLNFVGLKPLDTETLGEITSHIYNQGLKPYLPQHHLNPKSRQILLDYYSIFDDALLKLLDWNELDWSWLFFYC